MTRAAHPSQPLATLAALLADRTRATFCIALLDGRAWTAGELAREAGVAASTATEHVNQLVEGGLLVDERQGRHRYVRLADGRAAQMIEDLAAYAEPPVTSAQGDDAPALVGPRPASSTLRAATIASALRHARTCYDHLAGRVGVLLIDAMDEKGLLDRANGIAVTSSGLAWLDDLGVDVGTLRGARRPIVRHCLDWTERRQHLAGSAGAAICERFFATKWIERIGSDRAVRVTPAGRHGLEKTLGLTPETLTR
jgi:DNA-binding transcriptional ArsR family regulator